MKTTVNLILAVCIVAICSCSKSGDGLPVTPPQPPQDTTTTPPTTDTTHTGGGGTGTGGGATPDVTKVVVVNGFLNNVSGDTAISVLEGSSGILANVINLDSRLTGEKVNAVLVSADQNPTVVPYGSDYRVSYNDICHKNDLEVRLSDTTKAHIVLTGFNKAVHGFNRLVMILNDDVITFGAGTIITRVPPGITVNDAFVRRSIKHNSYGISMITITFFVTQ